MDLLANLVKPFGVWARRFRRVQTSRIWMTERQMVRKLLGSPQDVILRFPRAAIDYETTMTGPLRDG